MAQVTPSVDESIETLRRSQLPTVVTEGSDDYLYYRQLEERLSDLGVSLFPAGGRRAVLEIFERRREIGRNDVMFVVDQDLWVYVGIPDEYKHRKVVTTDGYSIENDLYRDGDLEQLLLTNERPKFSAELSAVVEWYSFALEKLLAGGDAAISHSTHRVLDRSGAISEEFARTVGFTGRCESLYRGVVADYKRLLRGKTLLDILVRRLSAQGRAIKHGGRQVMAIAASRNGVHSQRLEAEMRRFFLALATGAGAG